MRIGIIHAMAPPNAPRPSLAAYQGFALIAAMADHDPSWTMIGYGEPPPGLEPADRFAWKAPSNVDDPWQELADTNPDRLDALLILDPHALISAGFRPPAKPLRRLAMLAVLGDPGQVRGSEGNLIAPESAVRVHADWHRLGRYDLLWTTSPNASRTWAGIFGLPPDRIHEVDDPETAIEASSGPIRQRIDELVAPSKWLLPVSRSARVPRPKLAIFSPWPPKGSGIADYASRLARSLQGRYSIDLYHESGYIPDPALRSGEFGAYDVRFFEQRDRVFGYRGVLYQMGNSPYHGFVHEALRRRPGIVTLHDYCLSGFQFWRAHEQTGDPFQNLRRLIAEHYPDRFEAFDPHLRSWTEEAGGFAEALAKRGLAVNRDVFEAANAVVVHSPWSADRVRRSLPKQSAKTVVIPHGASPRSIPEARRREVRERFGLPVEGVIVGVFGILATGKMNAETIVAFREVAEDHPAAFLAFAGADWEDGAARRIAGELGIAGRIRFLGRQPESDYLDLIASVDLGISLRRPPTHGETSGALLDLLRHGTPTIVNEAGTFADYPDSVVRRVHWEREGQKGLVAALRELLDNPCRRRMLGEAACQYVKERHGWPRIAALYADVIERVAEGGGTAEDVARRQVV